MESSPANRIPAGSSIREYDGPLPRGARHRVWFPVESADTGPDGTIGKRTMESAKMNPDGEGCEAKKKGFFFLDMANSPGKSLRLHKADEIAEWDHLPSILLTFCRLSYFSFEARSSQLNFAIFAIFCFSSCCGWAKVAKAAHGFLAPFLSLPVPAGLESGERVAPARRRIWPEPNKPPAVSK